MSISRAEQDPCSLASYCDADDVRLLLVGVAPDAEGDALEAWTTGENVSSVIASQLTPTRMRLDDAVGTDFGYHENVDVALDGPGTERLSLAQWGFVPLLDVTSITISDSDQTLTDYVWDESGLITPVDYYGGYPVWARGNKNIELTLTWGWESPPADVVDAQAKMVAIHILSVIRAAQVAEPGVGGGYQRVQFGELTFSQYREGRYAPTIKEWKEDIKRVIAKYRNVLVSHSHPAVYGLTPGTRLAYYRKFGE